LYSASSLIQTSNALERSVAIWDHRGDTPDFTLHGIHQYSFYRPMEDGRLSRPRHCSKGAQPVPKAVYCSGCCDKHKAAVGFDHIQRDLRRLITVT